MLEKEMCSRETERQSARKVCESTECRCKIQIPRAILTEEKEMGVQNDITCTRPSAGNPLLRRPGVPRTCVDFFFESNSRSTSCGSTFCIAQTDLVIRFIHYIHYIHSICFNDKHIYSEAARD
ncbi:PREDICTED: uncharacterized protein LOC105150908 [Acromyrmex echinatior]|uniref:uncharacterized protein LOC105150908 n=1 Tax=Acromyrmex echinatior TaxID=103372 RepID=UPI000580F08E|nr:PREDICTED: uncharacterized protein LOC105150908 [Acromyrmex echinatior]